MSSPSDLEIVSIRVFAAPPAEVFQAWVDPQRLARWWGPAGFTNTFHEFNPVPGGDWRFIMHGPDGTDYDNHNVFVEVDAPARIVLKHVTAPLFQLIATFEALGEGTLLVFRMVFESVKTCAAVSKYAVAANEQNFDRLAAELLRGGAAPRRPDSAEFRITRVFDAPRDLVWAAHCDPAHLAHWWGPKGFDLRIAALDFRPGGRFHYAMVAPGGFEMWGRFTYLEIQAPERLVWINSFADAQGGLIRHPMSADWPLLMRITVTFTEADGKTTLDLRSVAHDASEAECRVFEAGFESMTGGFSGTYDKLADYLALVQG